jgi:type VI secretion system protein ImpK
MQSSGREGVESEGLHELQQNLAGIFQECLTIVARLRSGRLQIPEESQFRRRIIDLLRSAQDKARECGYSDAASKSCILALVAFLDESVLNLPGSGFAHWRGRPLNEELYGHALAGEKFFENLKGLLAQDDGDELADVLEVYYLCMLLGFRGRYAVTADSDLNTVLHKVNNRLSRMRPPSMSITSSQRRSMRGAGRRRGRGAPRLMVLAAVALLAGVLLFAGFRYSLSSTASAIDAIVGASGQN